MTPINNSSNIQDKHKTKYGGCWKHANKLCASIALYQVCCHLPDRSTDSLSIAVFPSTAKQCSFSKVWTSPSQEATIFSKCVSDTPSFLNMQL